MQCWLLTLRRPQRRRKTNEVTSVGFLPQQATVLGRCFYYAFTVLPKGLAARILNKLY